MGGRIPYGYRLTNTVIDNIRTSMYEEVPEESEQLKLIYSMYADTDNSLGDIVRYLNEHQIKNLQDAETEKQAKEAGVDPAMLSTVSSRGRIAIANASSSRQAKLCRIEEVDFFNLEQEYVDFTVTVNGIDVVRMTEEEMRQNFSGLEKEPETNITGETVYYQKDGDYTIEFTCYDGMVTGVSVLREFGKSYMPV